MKLFNDTQSTKKTAFSDVVKNWIPNTSAQKLWSKFPTINNDDEAIKKLLKTIKAQKVLFENEKILSKKGRSAIVIGEKLVDGETIPTLSIASVNNVIYNEFYEADIVELARTIELSSGKYTIYEKHTKNEVIRQVAKNGQEISFGQFTKETDLTILPKWQHNYGIVMAYVEQNKFTIGSYVETADLYLVENMLPQADLIWNTFTRELENGASQYYIKTGSSGFGMNDTIKQQLTNGVKSDVMFSGLAGVGGASMGGANQIEIDFKQANFRATLPHLSSAQDQILSTILTFLADKEYSFENVGTVQQTSLERSQTENVKILSLNEKSASRTIMMEHIFKCFNKVNPAIPAEIEIEFHTQPAYANEMTQALGSKEVEQKATNDGRGGDE